MSTTLYSVMMSYESGSGEGAAAQPIVPKYKHFTDQTKAEAYALELFHMIEDCDGPSVKVFGPRTIGDDIFQATLMLGPITDPGLSDDTTLEYPIP